MNTSIPGLYIDHAPAGATSGATFPNINPATGATLCDVQTASAADVDRAVASAANAFADWSQRPAVERGRILQRAAQLLREHNDRLARLEVLDTGKPIQEASAVDVHSGADCLEYFGGLIATARGSYVELENAFGYVRREPLGVCAGIGAWNYPIQIACWKSAPALACGNTMVFKPSELTPTTAMELAAIYREAGLPPGVFNVAQGGPDTGRALTTHAGVAKVSLTGEAATGKRVVADAAGTLKHVTMELGGKSPLIVFESADLRNAVSGAMMANFYTQGEICSNGTRVFVHASIHDEFVASLVARTGRMVIGDAMDPATQVGAVISREHLEKVLGYVETGVREGATLVCGGERRTVSGCEGGCFVAPAVFTGCSDGMTIVREEIFGPVMTVLPFTDEDEVVARANDTPFGLAAGVFTRDLAQGHRVVARLQAGTCWINDYNVTPIELPFGGYKESGLGRENGWEALAHYTQAKSVYVALGDVDCPY